MKRSDNLPKVFHVNWFRKDADGRFMWPGFGENMRVLKWITDRCQGAADAVQTPIGYVPAADSIDTEGLNVDAQTMAALLAVDANIWHDEVENIESYFAEFGDRIPPTLNQQVEKIRAALEAELAA